MNISYKNKVVVVTGAAGVICSEIAKEFAKAGAKVALLDLNLELATKEAEKISKEFGTAKAYECNVLKKESIEKAHSQILSDLGPCDILINGAGGNNAKANTDVEFHNDKVKDCKTFFDLDQSGFEFVFNLNILGTLLPTQVFAKDMLNKKDCSIINISSMNAYRPLTKIPAYSSAKAAVSNLTQWLAVHFSKTNIRVNGIAPGFLVTAQNKDLLFDKNNNPTDRAKKILNNTPIGRFGEANELVGTLLFLASDYAKFINGVIIPIDGGFSAYSGV